MKCMYSYVIHNYLNYFRTRLECLQVTPKDWSSCDRYVCRANLVSRFPRHGTLLLVGVLHEHTAATSSKQSTHCSNPDPHNTRSGPLRENANNAKQRSWFAAVQVSRS